jgi:AraC family transcriptional regulator of adaptative response / DNA-3-methyladenine glycosylase II
MVESMEDVIGLDRAALDRARISRDPRFDGRFFIAVTSTGIYCRPVCPSRSSNSANVRYYATAVEAAEAGFRPCLRCRPEAAPGTPAWLGTSAVVRRALRLIEDGALDEASVDDLATGLGIGPRHLHRLFMQHVGASPVTVAQTRRLHFAKRLLDDTSLPITQIALAAGFGSLRRFNAAFQRVYRRSPRDLRRHRPHISDDVALRLAYRPPYDWHQVRDCLAARAVPGVERVDPQGYARTVAVDGGHAIVRVRPVEGEHALELRISGASAGELFRLSAAARRMFDLAADPDLIARALARDPLLAALVAGRPGLRIAGAWDPFECAMTVLLGRRKVATVVARCGRPIAGGDGLTHLSPPAEALASADLDGLEIAAPRLAALRGLARAVVERTVDFAAPVGDVVGSLARLPGLGVAAAEQIALLSLGEPDAFPAADRALRRAAGLHEAPSRARELAARAEAWRPWRGYAAFHLSIRR